MNSGWPSATTSGARLLTANRAISAGDQRALTVIRRVASQVYTNAFRGIEALQIEDVKKTVVKVQENLRAMLCLALAYSLCQENDGFQCCVAA